MLKDNKPLFLVCLAVLILKLIALFYIDTFGGAAWRHSIISLGPDFEASTYVPKGLILGADLATLGFLLHWMPSRAERIYRYYWCNPILFCIYYISGAIAGFSPLFVLAILYAMEDEDHVTASLLTIYFLTMVPQGFFYLPLLVGYYITQPVGLKARWRYAYPILIVLSVIWFKMYKKLRRFNSRLPLEIASYTEAFAFKGWESLGLAGVLSVSLLLPFISIWVKRWTLLEQFLWIASMLSLLCLYSGDWCMLLTLWTYRLIRKESTSIYLIASANFIYLALWTLDFIVHF